VLLKIWCDAIADGGGDVDADDDSDDWYLLDTRILAWHS